MTTLHPLVPQPDDMAIEHAQVLIVGAGPVGLFLALKLAQAGIDVLVVEAEKEVLQSPRATTYMPIVLQELEKVGLYHDVEQAGHKNHQGIVFRKPHAQGGQVLGRLEMSQVPKEAVKYDFAGIHLGQHVLAGIILAHCQRWKNIRIRWNCRFVGARQGPPSASASHPEDKGVPDPDGASASASASHPEGEGDPAPVTVPDGEDVSASHPESESGAGVSVICVGAQGERHFRCDYLVGADGAASAVRRSLCIPFDGFTWPDFRFVACNVHYDFEALGDFATANMVVDGEDWAVIARTGPAGAPWRVAFGVRTDVSEADILTRELPAKFERLFPGPRPLRYDLVSANPYWAHQRVARTFKVGRVLLCGDAGHSNNPIGGLGLTTGLLDSAALGNCLIRIYKNKHHQHHNDDHSHKPSQRESADDNHSPSRSPSHSQQESADDNHNPNQQESPDALLDRYARVRRDAWINFTNPQSIDFKLRLHSSDPDVERARAVFFHALNTDPEIHLKMASMMNEVVDDEFELVSERQTQTMSQAWTQTEAQTEAPSQPEGESNKG
ncbi:hypothetical protein A1O3_01750 [Capronia epimyces CBS 606.96]|uniref:FAD-binding domain-containing protein n=1 Tax=Capronia epimyces CBS 606.96 TaxID=1182542 RepID=W9YKU3_9EURO|nr:uncharacterized protein A1O3_01750 [Capronia epimyces CBS 606.96]EXJ93193.1 hypothetical protein A1O3_01750 [Capronia epimyces CBS 606.96]